jgi:hypothetical protein
LRFARRVTRRESLGRRLDLHLEHDPEKWKPVPEKIMLKQRNPELDPIQPNWIEI